MKYAKLLGNGLLSVAVVAVCGFAAPSPSYAQGMNSTSTSTTTSTADQHFVKKAAEGGMAEVELGQLAEQKASSPDVKKFAERMVNDHTKANDQLKQLAESQGITLPMSLSAKDEATKQKLSGLSGAEFDKAYMHDMVTDHTKDVSEFRQESTSAQDAAVKSFASETLPTLESHLREARRIAPKVETASR